jgi:hypothetical protein
MTINVTFILFWMTLVLLAPVVVAWLVMFSLEVKNRDYIKSKLSVDDKAISAMVLGALTSILWFFSTVRGQDVFSQEFIFKIVGV